MIFDWHHDKFQRILGANAEAFDLDSWYRTLDDRAVTSPHVIPECDSGAWLETQLLEEAQLRGLPMAPTGPPRPFTAQELADAKQLLIYAWGRCKHDPPCENSQICIGNIIRKWRANRGEAVA